MIHVSYSRGYWSHWYIYVIIKKILGIKYIVTIHGGGLTKWKPNYPYLSFFKNSEVITGVSNRIIKEYENRSKRKLIFTPPLIPFRILSNKKELRKKWGLDPDQTVLLYVGSIKPLKAVDSLIEALSRLSKESINRNQLTIFIAGEGISKKSLELRVFELGLESNIFFLGNIERSKVPELYCIADLYTLCSEFEGLPISLLEAFANKLPCITSDAPGISEMSLNNQNSLMFKTRDSNDYAKKLDSLLNNKELRNKLGKNAYKFYHKNYSYHVLINSFKDIIDKT